jgi:DNA polymerase-1
MWNKKSVFLIDGSSYIYRAYYALPPLQTSEGFPTGAIYGFLRMILKILKNKKPQYMAVVLEGNKKPNFRKKIFSQYKAQRKKIANPLKMQIPIIKKLTALLGVPLYSVEGFEADDVIATLTKKFIENQFSEVVIYSPDKDLIPLIALEKVKLINPLTEEEITREKVLKKFGVAPEIFPHYLALVGDKVDNIPGVEGVGPKKALEILKVYPDINLLIKNWKNLPPAIKKLLKNTSPEELERNLKLVELNYNVPIENFTPENFRLKKPQYETLIKELEKLEMKSLIKELEKLRYTSRTLF